MTEARARYRPRRRLTDVERILATMPEADFQAQIVETAQWLGWMVYHDYDSRRSEAGYPDLTLVHPTQRRVLFIECKTERGQLSAAQLHWLGALMLCPGVETVTARPSDIDRVLELLQGR